MPLLVALLGAALTAHAEDLPYDEVPASLQADNFDRFYLDYGERVVRFTDREDHVFTYTAPPDWSIARIEHLVSPVDGAIYTLEEIRKTECNTDDCSSSTSYSRILLITCTADGQCREQQLASTSRSSGSTSYTSYRAQHRVTEKGTLLVALMRTQHSQEGSETSVSYRCGGEECTEEQFEEQPFAEMAAVPTYRIDPSSREIYGGALGERKSRVRLGDQLLDLMANTDTSLLYDGQGNPHVFYFSAARRLTHVFVDTTGTEPRKVERVVDMPESGASNAAVRYGPKGILAFHYFYRNSYHKGVKATLWVDGAALAVWSGEIEASRDLNPGWKLRAAATPQGRVLVGYQRDPKRDLGYRLRLFDDIDALRAEELPPPEGWEARHKPWFGLLGAGASYAMWVFGSSTPEVEDFEGVANPDDYRMDAAYRVSPTPMLSATAEAKFGPFTFGTSFAKGILRDAARDAGLSDKQFERLSARFGIDKIIKYHDIRVAMRYGRVSMRYDLAVPGNIEGRSAKGTIVSTYQRTDVYLLNTWRVRYGLFQQSYRAWLPFYVWGIDEGALDYTFIDSFSAPARLGDFGLTVGYSRLDYAAKFENKLNTLFLDGDIGLGWSTATLDTPFQPEPETTGRDPAPVRKPFALLVPFNAELGFIVLRRSHALRGLGWYSRLGYRTEGSWAGTNGRPPERDEAAEEASQRAGFDRFELRHGPFFDLGTVF